MARRPALRPDSFHDGRVQLYAGDCLAVLDQLPPDSLDAAVTDPPYHLKRFGAKNATARTSRGFMAKEWDGGNVAFQPGTWAKVLRVLKPGAYLVAFGGTRTYHRLTSAISDAGFEICDQLAWIYNSGFPKSTNISKMIDKELGAKRTKVRVPASKVRNPKATGGGRDGMEGATCPWIVAAIKRGYHEVDSNDPVTEEAKKWDGWGTALKPAWEPIVLARKLGDAHDALIDSSQPQLRYLFTAKANKIDRLGSKHPTVKPVALMQWLVRLVTPPGGTVLDPFAGSGTTGEAAWREGVNAILVEREAEYQADIRRRNLQGSQIT